MELRPSAWRVASTLAIIGLLALSVLQLHGVEARLLAQSQQIRVLGEATERMASRLERLHAGASTSAVAADQPPVQKVLHPEVKDFFSARETHWPPPGAKTNGRIVWDWFSGDPKGFNPVIETSSDLRDKLRSYVEASLGQRNRWTDPDKYYADLAWRVEVTEDYKVFTFYLRQGVKWHPVSGVDLSLPRYAWLNREHELTAHDFVFYFDMVMHPQVQNGFLKSYFEQLESWKALDDYTFQVRWKKTEAGNVEQTLLVTPLPKFLYAYAEDGTPFPEATLGAALNQHWYNSRGMVGTGPYRLSEYVPGSHITLERNDQYFGEAPAIKTVRYLVYADRTQTVLKLKSGELSFGQLRAGQYREEVQRLLALPEAQRPKDNPFVNGQIQCDVVDLPAYQFIGWNADLPLFSDRRVRTAMTLAINRPELVSKVFSGLGTIARGPFLEASGDLAPDVQALPFDLRRAAASLAEAGWVDTDGDGLLDKADASGRRTPFEFTLLMQNNSPEWNSAANVIKEDLLSIGVKMSIDGVEFGTLIKRLDEKKFQAYQGGWALPWSTDPYQIWHSSQADVPKGSNRVAFRNPRADALIEQLRLTLEPKARRELFWALHRILHEEQPYTFVYVPKVPYCHRSSIKGVIYAKERPLYDFQPWWSEQADG